MRRDPLHSEDLFGAARHPLARRRHVRQVWLQIALPLGLGGLLGGAGLYTLLAANVGNAARAAQVATLFLAIPLILIGVILLVALVAAIYFTARAMRWIPEHTIYLHRRLQQANHAVLLGADYAAKPMLAAQSWGEALRRVFQRERLR